MADRKDISHWSNKRKLAWIRRQLMRSRHYAPAFEHMQVKWDNENFKLCAPHGSIYGSLEENELHTDGWFTKEELHDMWIILSGIDHYYALIFEQKMLPMDHGK